MHRGPLFVDSHLSSFLISIFLIHELFRIIVSVPLGRLPLKTGDFRVSSFIHRTCCTTCIPHYARVLFMAIFFKDRIESLFWLSLSVNSRYVLLPLYTATCFVLVSVFWFILFLCFPPRCKCCKSPPFGTFLIQHADHAGQGEKLGSIRNQTSHPVCRLRFAPAGSFYKPAAQRFV